MQKATWFPDFQPSSVLPSAHLLALTLPLTQKDQQEGNYSASCQREWLKESQLFKCKNTQVHEEPLVLKKESIRGVVLLLVFYDVCINPREVQRDVIRVSICMKGYFKARNRKEISRLAVSQ